MKMRKRRRSFLLAGLLLVLMGGLFVWFRLPYSPLAQSFHQDTKKVKAQQPMVRATMSREKMAVLPEVIQRYLLHCGYQDQPLMRWMTVRFEDVAFYQNPDEPALTIDYTQVNTAAKPVRLAFIDSSYYGVSFEGYDYYLHGEGRMKGVLGKVVPLFDQRGVEMDRAALVTYLAESIFMPSALLSDAFRFEEIDAHTVRARLTAYGQTVSGLFTFNDDAEMTSFTTNDRSLTEDDGTMTPTPWTMRCDDYRASSAGAGDILQPTTFRITWHLADGDFTYFDGKVKAITYDD